VKQHRSLVRLAAAGLLVAVVSVGVPGSAAAAPNRQAAGGGSATSSTADLRELASSPGMPPQTSAKPNREQDRGGAALPARPTVGRRPNLAAAQPGAPVQPLAPAVVTNFDGISEATGCGTCEPPDPNAATSGSEIVELVNIFMQVTDNSGNVRCGINLKTLLGTTDGLTDPRVQYDNVNGRFSLAVTVDPVPAGATPAMWVAATFGADACGSWHLYRLTFQGNAYPAGTFLDFPMFGQDQNALLVSTRNFTHPGINFTVFGLPKPTIYAGATVSFNSFFVASLTAPVTNAGQPMISSPFSYFLAAVPGTGYRLYRLTNSGGPGATLTLQATISASFSAPTRRANQPGTTATLDPSDGNILTSPFYDGANIWFAHDVDLVGFPTIRYGRVTVSNNTVATAFAFHSSTSDDFNPSLGLGINPAGGEYVYVNWAYTDTPRGVATSVTVDSVPPFGGLPNLIATGTVLVNGSITGQDRFGDFSTVTVDPTVPAGSCAVATQQYFAPGGSWRTRVARLGSCQVPVFVAVPDVTGDFPDEAASVLVAAGLTVRQFIGTTDCNHLGEVSRTDPRAGAVVTVGSAVDVFIGQEPPPPAVCP
jgi:hypothetical protein